MIQHPDQQIVRAALAIPDSRVDYRDDILSLLARRKVVEARHHAAAQEAFRLKGILDALPERRAAIVAELVAVGDQVAWVAAEVLLGKADPKEFHTLHFKREKLQRELELVDLGKPGLEGVFADAQRSVSGPARNLSDIDIELTTAREEAKLAAAIETFGRG